MQTQSALIILCVAATLSTPSYAQRAAKSKLEQLEQQQKEIQREIAMLQAVSENQNSSSVKQAEKNPKLVASQLNELRPEIRVFSLKYTQAAQVSDVMRAIHNDTSNTRFAVDSRTNRLIVHAPPRIHDQVVSVLAEIDRKPDSAKSRSFRIRNSEAARQIANHLDRLNLSSVRWTSDHLQVSAESMSELDQAEKLIREIEETARPQSRTIRIVWLATKNGESVG